MYKVFFLKFYYTNFLVWSILVNLIYFSHYLDIDFNSSFTLDRHRNRFKNINIINRKIKQLILSVFGLYLLYS